MTPLDALADVERFMEAASLDYAKGNRPDIADAMRLIDKALEDATNHDCEAILGWGEPGDCMDRIVNDPDILDALLTEGFTTYEIRESFGMHSSIESDSAVMDTVKRLGLGAHHGNPHCIWCLQGD